MADPREGYVNFLFRKVAAYAADPAREMERIAQQALHDGAIDARMYAILRHLIPFHGTEHKALRDMAQELSMHHEKIAGMQAIIYRRLSPYVSLYQVDHLALRKSVNRLLMDSPDFVGYQGNTYAITILDSDVAAPPSASAGETDIYVPATVPAHFRRAVIMHRIIEADLKMQRASEDRAHELATKHEMKYAAEMLAAELFEEYQHYRERMSI